MKPLHKEDIKSSIRKKFDTLANFERESGLPKGSVKDVLRGKSVSRTAEAMAVFLGVDFKAISPNQKRTRSRTTDDMSTKVDLHRLNEGAK